MCMFKALRGWEFQSTFPRGERLHEGERVLTKQQFQSTFPRGERLVQVKCVMQLQQYFNPRSRVGNDDKDVIDFVCDSFDFNPRSRVGNDKKVVINGES